MSTANLFTIHVYKLPPSDELNPAEILKDESQKISVHPNFSSARVIKGRTIELEHSKLTQEDVKFKTIINYDEILEQGASLALALVPQKEYITKLDQ